MNNTDADKDALEKAATDLSEKIMPIGAKMYQQSSGADAKKDEANGAGTSDFDKSSSKDDDAVEGEVVDK